MLRKFFFFFFCVCVQFLYSIVHTTSSQYVLQLYLWSRRFNSVGKHILISFCVAFYILNYPWCELGMLLLTCFEMAILRMFLK